MKFIETLKLALAAIWAHKLRSALTLLGMIVGVTAFVVVVSLIQGFNRYVDEKIAAVNARIDGLEARVQQNADAAAAASSAAQAANSTAQANGQRIDQLTGRVDALEQRMASKSPRN